MNRTNDQFIASAIQNEIADQSIIAAFRKVPREYFVPKLELDQVYRDVPLPIGYGQTSSQPSLVAIMTTLLDPKPNDQVLEIGTGSGYQAAILSHIVDRVDSIERIPELAKMAQKNLEQLGCTNVQVHIGDGALGLPERAPFDKIIVTAAARSIPTALQEQLSESGIMLIPLKHTFGAEYLYRVSKTANQLQREKLFRVGFVPLISERL